MINPINLIKLDDLRDNKGKTFHVGPLPEYEQEDYDLSNPKDFNKYIKDVKNEIRGSFEYRELIKYLRNFGGMDRSGLNQNISNTDSNKVKIEIHHTPLTLEDIVKIVYEKRLFYHENLSVEMVAKEVMECHYKGIIGLYPLSATEHELVHNGYLYIPPSMVFGRYDLFIQLYKPFIDEDDLETLESIEDHEKVFNSAEQNKLLTQSNIYIDPSGAYEIPMLDTLKDRMSNRIDTIKNNMYSLPVLNEEIPKEELKEAIYFVNDKGERINEPIS